MYKVGDPVDYIFRGKKYTGNIIDLGNSRLVPNYFKLDKLHNGKNRINANDVIPSPIAKIQERLQFLKDVDEQCPEIKLSTDDAKIQELEMVLKWLGEE